MHFSTATPSNYGATNWSAWNILCFFIGYNFQLMFIFPLPCTICYDLSPSNVCLEQNVLLIRLFVVSSSLNFAHFFVWVSNQKSVENFQQGVFVATKDYAVMWELCCSGKKCVFHKIIIIFTTLTRLIWLRVNT